LNAEKRALERLVVMLYVKDEPTLALAELALVMAGAGAVVVVDFQGWEEGKLPAKAHL
jgi:hypothetical protein